MTVQAVGVEDVLSFRAAGVLVQSRLAVAESYNDNIYYRPSKPVPGFTAKPEDDFVSTISPGVTFQLGNDEASYLDLDYGLTSLLYALHPDDNALDHSIGLRGRYSGRKLSLTGVERVDFLSSIYGGSSTLGTKLNRMTLAGGYSVAYQMTEKTSTYLEAEHNTIDFDQGTPLYDSDSMRGTIGFGYQWSPKLGFFGEGYYGKSSTDSNHPLLLKGPDSWVLGGYVGARGEFTARLSGMLKLGYEGRGYDDGSDAPGGPVVEAAVSHRFSEKASASLGYSRRSFASIQFNRYSYVRDGVTLSYNQMLGNTGRLTANGNARFEMDTYDPTLGRTDRNDQRILLGASMAYQIKLWMVASLNYEFEKFSSDASGTIDYDVNRITVQLSVGY